MIKRLDFRQLKWENPNMTQWQLIERELELMEEKINEITEVINGSIGGGDESRN